MPLEIFDINKEQKGDRKKEWLRACFLKIDYLGSNPQQHQLLALTSVLQASLSHRCAAWILCATFLCPLSLVCKRI